MMHADVAQTNFAARRRSQDSPRGKAFPTGTFPLPLEKRETQIFTKMRARYM